MDRNSPLHWGPYPETPKVARSHGYPLRLVICVRRECLELHSRVLCCGWFVCVSCSGCSGSHAKMRAAATILILADSSGLQTTELLYIYIFLARVVECGGTNLTSSSHSLHRVYPESLIRVTSQLLAATNWTGIQSNLSYTD